MTLRSSVGQKFYTLTDGKGGYLLGIPSQPLGRGGKMSSIFKNYKPIWLSDPQNAEYFENIAKAQAELQRYTNIRAVRPDLPKVFIEVFTVEAKTVMWETAKLTERVDNLAAAIEKLGPSFEKSFDKHGTDMKERLGEIKGDVKDGSTKIAELKKRFPL